MKGKTEMYKFTGRVEQIGIDNGCNFCEFDVDNCIDVDDCRYGIAYEVQPCGITQTPIKIITVEKFSDIEKEHFEILLNFQNERFEIVYELNDTFSMENPTIEELAKEPNKKLFTQKAYIKRVAIIK